mmetsp:Transcript_60774/g.100371  ORF Transcript_60774/g.100371 Transcript_60774/m.100371 type:complete len:216 (-) Transcript_60774:2252-2899(-)
MQPESGRQTLDVRRHINWRRGREDHALRRIGRALGAAPCIEELLLRGHLVRLNKLGDHQREIHRELHLCSITLEFQVHLGGLVEDVLALHVHHLLHLLLGSNHWGNRICSDSAPTSGGCASGGQARNGTASRLVAKIHNRSAVWTMELELDSNLEVGIFKQHALVRHEQTAELCLYICQLGLIQSLWRGKQSTKACIRRRGSGSWSRSSKDVIHD